MEKIEKDFEELLQLFNKHKIHYCVVGGFAIAFYGVPRYTKDLDLFVRPDITNGKKIIQALKEFGFKSLKISEQDFAKPGFVIQLGYEPVRVDLITQIDGLTFEEVWKTKKKSVYGSEKIVLIGKKALIKNKKASGRKQDLADVEMLEGNHERNN
jgi:hypothetical protein